MHRLYFILGSMMAIGTIVAACGGPAYDWKCTKFDEITVTEINRYNKSTSVIKKPYCVEYVYDRHGGR